MRRRKLGWGFGRWVGLGLRESFGWKVGICYIMLRRRCTLWARGRRGCRFACRAGIDFDFGVGIEAVESGVGMEIAIGFGRRYSGLNADSAP